MSSAISPLVNYTDGWRPSLVVGWDTETAWDPDEPHLTPPVVCLTLAGNMGTASFAVALAEAGALVRWSGVQWAALVDSTMDVGEAFRSAVASADACVAHNLAYDYGIAANEGWMSQGELAALVEHGMLRDTMIREMLIAVATDNYQFDKRLDNTKTKFSLARLAQVYLGKDREAQKTGPDIWRTRYRELLGIPWQEWPEEAIAYAIEDATDARDIFCMQGEPRAVPEGTIVNHSGNVVNERADTQASVALHYMTMCPPKANPNKVQAFALGVEADVHRGQQAGTRVGIYRINKCKTCTADSGTGGTGWVGNPPNLRVCPTCKGDPGFMPPRTRKAFGDPKGHKARLQAWVKYALGEYAPMTDPSDTYPRGQVKTDANTARSTGIPDLVVWADAQEAQKLLNDYVPVLQKEAVAGRISCRYTPVLRTGRTSVSGFPWQRPPRAEGFRECFEADRGYVFCSVDYSSVEMVTLAQTCLEWFGYSKLAEALNAGKDPHLVFAAWMLSIPYDEALRLRKAGDPAIKQARQEAKIANFGFPGGLGVTTFVEYAASFGTTISVNRAQDLKDMFLEAWPEMREYFTRVGEMADRGLPDRFGRQRFTVRQEPTGRLRGGAHYTSACNTMFQGRAADLAKRAMWLLHKACYIDTSSVLYGCRIWAFVHDEFLLQGPALTAHLWGPEVKHIMVAAGQPFVPDVELKAEEALAYVWSKNMAPRYSEDGTLVPCDTRD